MKVAVFGCLHGMIDEMYASVARHEFVHKINIDLILVCGDCQTIRHWDDVQCVSVPDRYKKLGDFHKYYSGECKIPKLTIFVGGNHEASNYLMTLPYGGWVCDNFYYLGYAGVINYKGLRIAGVSGIFHPRDCKRGRFERLPFNYESKKSIYHTREVDIFRLKLLSNNIDVLLTHDWPRGIYDFGDKNQLMRFKPFFRKEIMSRILGSPLTQPLIDRLKPRRWFAAHLHCKFEAKVLHGEQCTEFLSLNKIENGRNYMEVIDIASEQENQSDSDSESDDERQPDQSSQMKQESHPDQGSQVKQEGHPDQGSQVKQEGHPDQGSQVKQESDPDQGSQVKQEGHPDQGSQVKQEGHPDQGSQVKHENQPKEEGQSRQGSQIKQENQPDQGSQPKHEKPSEDLYYDPEWLTIIRNTITLEKKSEGNIECPSIESENGKTFLPTQEQIKETVRLMKKESSGLKIKKNFRMVEPVVHGRPGSAPVSMDHRRERNYTNFQTDELVKRLELQQANGYFIL